MHENITRRHWHKGVGVPSASDAAGKYMQAVTAWMKEMEAKITKNHCLRCNAARIYYSAGVTRYERSADLVLKGELAGTIHDKTIKRRVVVFEMEWEAEP